MKSSRQKIRHIVVVVRLSFQSGRDLLYGISKYAAKHCRWRFHIISDSGSPSVDELRDPERHGIDGITAADVARHLGVSRRLADLRFRQFEHRSLLDAILEARLEILKRRLREDGATIGQTVARCGFRNESYAKRLFKARFGQTMSDYRLQGATRPAEARR